MADDLTPEPCLLRYVYLPPLFRVGHRCLCPCGATVAVEARPWARDLGMFTLDEHDIAVETPVP